MFPNSLETLMCIMCRMVFIYTFSDISTLEISLKSFDFWLLEVTHWPLNSNIWYLILEVDPYHYEQGRLWWLNWIDSRPLFCWFIQVVGSNWVQIPPVALIMVIKTGLVQCCPTVSKTSALLSCLWLSAG